jgi:recombinase
MPSVLGGVGRGKLVEPLCRFLLAEPNLALKPRTPKEWAHLLRDFRGDSWDAHSQLDDWAVRHCFRHHRHRSGRTAKHRQDAQSAFPARCTSSPFARIMQVFYSGLAPFGYRHVPLRNAATLDDKSRTNHVGVTLETVEFEARTIRRIYDMYAYGLSSYCIAKSLNEDGVPAVRKPRSGKASFNWSSNLIERILRNEKYIGMNVWIKRMRHLDPDTGKIDTCEKPSSEHLRIERDGRLRPPPERAGRPRCRDDPSAGGAGVPGGPLRPGVIVEQNE